MPMRTFSHKFLALTATLLASATLLFLASTGKGRGAEPRAATAAGVLAADKGKLKILLDGQNIGSEEFEIAPSGPGWMARGATDLQVPEGTGTRVRATLALQPDGVPVSYEWTAQSGKKNGAHIVFARGVARITLEMEGARPFEQNLTFGSPRIAVLDNNLYHHYAILAWLYDWSRRGPQDFPVLIPQELTPGTITVEATGSQNVDEKSYEGLRVKTADLEVLLYLDKEHRLMRLDVPSAKVSVVRE